MRANRTYNMLCPLCQRPVRRGSYCAHFQGWTDGLRLTEPVTDDDADCRVLDDHDHIVANGPVLRVFRATVDPLPKKGPIAPPKG